MSLVFHSAHPHIPTLRADVRLFEVGTRLRLQLRACTGAASGLRLCRRRLRPRLKPLQPLSACL